MSISKNKLVIGASIAVAALGLVGAGTGATFTDSVFSSHRVQVGTFGVRIDPVAGDGANTDAHHVTLNQIGPVASTFQSAKNELLVTNTGEVVAHTYALKLTDVNDDANLRNIHIKVTSYAPTASTPPGSPDILFDGTIAAFEALPDGIIVNGDLTPAGTAQDFDKYGVEFYTPSGFSLGNDDEGHAIVPTLEVQYVG